MMLCYSIRKGIDQSINTNSLTLEKRSRCSQASLLVRYPCHQIHLNIIEISTSCVRKETVLQQAPSKLTDMDKNSGKLFVWFKPSNCKMDGRSLKSVCGLFTIPGTGYGITTLRGCIPNFINLQQINKS